MCPDHHIASACEGSSVVIYILVFHVTGKPQFGMVNTTPVNLPVFFHSKAAGSTLGVAHIYDPVRLAIRLKSPARKADDQIFRWNVFLCTPGWLLAFCDGAQNSVKFIRTGAIQGIVCAGTGLLAATCRGPNENAGEICRYRDNAVL